MIKKYKLPFKLYALMASALIPVFALSPAAQAAQETFFNTISLGRTEFETRIGSAGGTYQTNTLSGLSNGTSWDLGDFTITPTNGANRTIVANTIFNSAGVTAGQAIQMSAATNPSVTNTGLTFTFDSAINGIGFDLNDWATTGYPSNLYISFDGGAPILVGSASQGTDNPGLAANEGANTFIGGIDDAGTFTTVTFYGISTGNSDVLYAGGIVYYALVPLGGLSGGGYVDTAAPTGVSGLAGYLDKYDDSGDLQDVATYLNNASAEEVETALKIIFPTSTTVASQNMMSASGQTSSILLSKVGTVLGSTNSGGSSTVNFANQLGFSQQGSQHALIDPTNASEFEGSTVYALSQMPYQRFTTGQNAFWIEGVGAGANGKETDETLGYDTQSYGVVAGFEHAIRDDIIIGLLGSSFVSEIETDRDAGDTNVDNYNIGVYGQKLFGATKITALATVGYGDYDSKRNIDIGGVTGNPEASYDSWSYGGSLGVSHLFEHDGLKIEPFAMVSYTHADTDGFTEKNGGSFNMTVGDDSSAVASLRAGITLQHEGTVADKPFEISVKPYIGRQWEIEESGPAVRLAGANTASTINGRDIDTLEVGLGFQTKLEITEVTNLKGGFDISRDKNEERAVGYVGVGFKF